MLKFLTNNPGETIKLGKKIGKLLKPGFLIGLYGDLGSGKTTLTKGIAQSLGIKENEIHSPTFVLINQYQAKLPLYHIDFYRLENIEQIEELGIEEYLFSDGACIIEWAQKLGKLMPKNHIEIKLVHKGEHKRLIKIMARGVKYKDFIKELKAK